MAGRYGALVFMDECHATGFFGATGRGTDEYCGVRGRVHVRVGDPYAHARRGVWA